MPLQHNDRRPMVCSAQEGHLEEAGATRITGISFGVHRSRERRHLTAERFIFAKQMAEWKIRASVLGLTQRWLDLTEPRDNRGGPGCLRNKSASLSRTSA